MSLLNGDDVLAGIRRGAERFGGSAAVRAAKRMARRLNALGNGLAQPEQEPYGAEALNDGAKRTFTFVAKYTEGEIEKGHELTVEAKDEQDAWHKVAAKWKGVPPTSQWELKNEDSSALGFQSGQKTTTAERSELGNACPGGCKEWLPNGTCKACGGKWDEGLRNAASTEALAYVLAGKCAQCDATYRKMSMNPADYCAVGASAFEKRNASPEMLSRCKACGHESQKEWSGKCEGCGVANAEDVGGNGAAKENSGPKLPQGFDMKDFKEWSGGFTPDEVDEADLEFYCKDNLSAAAVEAWLDSRDNAKTVGVHCPKCDSLEPYVESGQGRRRCQTCKTDFAYRDGAWAAENAGGTHTKCVDCGAQGAVDAMAKNPDGAGFLCDRCVQDRDLGQDGSHKEKKNAGHLGPDAWVAASLDERCQWLESAGQDINLAVQPWHELSLDSQVALQDRFDRPASVNSHNGQGQVYAEHGRASVESVGADLGGTALSNSNPNGPSDEEAQKLAYERYKQHWDALSQAQQDGIYRELGYENGLRNGFADKASLKAERDAQARRVEQLTAELHQIEGQDGAHSHDSEPRVKSLLAEIADAEAQRKAAHEEYLKAHERDNSSDSELAGAWSRLSADDLEDILGHGEFTVSIGSGRPHPLAEQPAQVRADFKASYEDGPGRENRNAGPKGDGSAAAAWRALADGNRRAWLREAGLPEDLSAKEFDDLGEKQQGRLLRWSNVDGYRSPAWKKVFNATVENAAGDRLSGADCSCGHAGAQHHDTGRGDACASCSCGVYDPVVTCRKCGQRERQGLAVGGLCEECQNALMNSNETGVARGASKYGAKGK